MLKKIEQNSLGGEHLTRQAGEEGDFFAGLHIATRIFGAEPFDADSRGERFQEQRYEVDSSESTRLPSRQMPISDCIEGERWQKACGDIAVRAEVFVAGQFDEPTELVPVDGGFAEHGGWIVTV
jgi:hypothetical protein